MQQHTIFRLSTLLVAQVFLVGILAVPMLNSIVNSGTDLIVGGNFKDSVSFNSRDAMAIMETVMETVTAAVTAQPDVALAAGYPVLVTVTVTTIETTVVDTETIDPHALHSGGTAPVTSGGNQSETSTIIYTTEPSNDTSALSSKLASTTSTDVTPPTAGLITTLQHTNLTSSRTDGTNTDGTVTKLTTITSMASHSRPTSSFNNDLCDEIFCNTDGNKVCIYWAGVTSWDISLGPLPGERPTIIGTC
ncbi:hypothetical protein F5Y10DRAFT_286448 [Nemania abortiva]|nr:hypothetical protein F5Y10DRAFT_286448 [Nemania abortiva]